MQKNLKFFILAPLLFSGLFSIILQAQINTPTVKIGKQEWMLRNLDLETFRNGDVIPNAKSDEEWDKAYKEGKSAWCYYNNDPNNGLIYGKLYNWFAVNDSRGLAPKGYHVPSKAEWDSLISFVGGQSIAGKKLKSTQGWPDKGNGTNESGFSGLPGNIRYYSGYFQKISRFGHWWTATELPPFYAWQYYLTSLEDAIGFYSYDYGKGAGMSVRCLKD